MTTASGDRAILAPAERGGKQFAGWDPEDPGFWRRTGARVARRNLVFSVLSEHIGFSFAFGQVLQDQFGTHFLTAGKVDPVKIAYLTFLGPLVGSAARPAGGWLADRFGGARTTFWNFALMTAAGAAVLAASAQRSLVLFCAGFIALFALSGLGNGSTYKMIASYVICMAVTWVVYLRPGAADQQERKE
jgi:nitrate/nitrite transporter NarK